MENVNKISGLRDSYSRQTFSKFCLGLVAVALGVAAFAGDVGGGTVGANDSNHLFSVDKFSLGSVAMATQVPAFSLSQLTQYADAVVIATVVDVNPVRGPQYVVTDTTLKVDSVLKGTVNPKIVLHQRGGQVGDFATIVYGMPQYEVGERVLIFLEAKKTGTYVTAGYWQGKHEIYKKGGEDFVKISPVFAEQSRPMDDVHPHVHGMQPIRTKPDVVYDSTGLADQLIPLKEIVDKIKKVVAATSAPSSPSSPLGTSTGSKTDSKTPVQ